VWDLTCGGGRVRPRSQSAFVEKNSFRFFSTAQISVTLTLKSWGKHKIETPPNKFRKMKSISRF
jgi:hypothetical protein